MRGLHVFIVRDAAFRLAAQRNAAFCPKPKLECPINDWFGAGFDSSLVEPGIARFGERLNKIQRTAVAFFAVVKSDIANLECRHAFESSIGMNRAPPGCCGTYRDLEGRYGR